MRLPVYIFSVLLLCLCCQPAIAQKMNVKIVNRRSSETEYSYQVPGYFSSTSNGGANCYGNSTYSGSTYGYSTYGYSTYGNSTSNANCSASSTTNGSITPPRDVSYSVTGATFSLLLPDGRIAVVNCVSKNQIKAASAVMLLGGMGALAGHIRSCRMPLVDDIQADFKGKNAKLKWPVSVDGKKFESETYTILAILEKEKQSGNSHANAAAKTDTQ